jgi:hypothetical protein
VLPPQLIFAGKTDAALPAVRSMPKFSQWHFTHTENHWSTLETTKDWIIKIFMPYVKQVSKSQRPQGLEKCASELQTISIALLFS